MNQVFVSTFVLFATIISYGQICPEYKPSSFNLSPFQLSSNDEITFNSDLDLTVFPSSKLRPDYNVWCGTFDTNCHKKIEMLNTAGLKQYAIKMSVSGPFNDKRWNCSLLSDQSRIPKGTYKITDTVETSFFSTYQIGYIGQFNYSKFSAIHCVQSNQELVNHIDYSRAADSISEVLGSNRYISYLAQNQNIIEQLLGEVRSTLNSQAGVELRFCDPKLKSTHLKDNEIDGLNWSSGRFSLLYFSVDEKGTPPFNLGPNSLNYLVASLPLQVQKMLDPELPFGFSKFGQLLRDCRNGIHYCDSFKYQEYIKFVNFTEPSYFFRPNQWRLDRGRFIVKLNFTTSEEFRNQHNLKIVFNHYGKRVIDFGDYTLNCEDRHCLVNFDQKKLSKMATSIE